MLDMIQGTASQSEKLNGKYRVGVLALDRRIILLK
jgi:hypothetical protein